MREQSTSRGSQKILPSNSIPRETTELNYPRAIREECSNGCLSPRHTKNKGSMSGAKSLVALHTTTFNVAAPPRESLHLYSYTGESRNAKST